MKKQILTAITSGLVVLVLISSLASCAQPGVNITNITNVYYKDAEEESTDFVSESLPFYKFSNTPTDVFYARFYNGEHYVPYVSIRYYLETYDIFNLSKASYSDGKYSYEYRVNGKSFPMVIDVKNDTIYCAEWAGFTVKLPGNDSEAIIVEKMIKILKSYFGQKSLTFDLKKYGMEIYGGTDDAYVPLCVLNQMFTVRDYKEIFYNGEGVYYFQSDKAFIYENYKKSPWYMSEDGSVCQRPQKLIDLSYNMLCFSHEYFYGHPGYYGFADDGNGYPEAEKVRDADALDFDQLLSTYAPDVQTMLKSSSYLEYIKGLTKLLVNTYGDVHACPHYFNNTYFPNYGQAQKEEATRFNNDHLSNKIKKIIARGAELKTTRLTAPGRTDGEGNPEPLHCLSGDKTAVFTFDSFTIDADNWKAYYDSELVRENPNPYDIDFYDGNKSFFPNDSIGVFYKVLYTLLNNDLYSDVETVLIDISCNGGGSDFCLMNFLAYLFDYPVLREYDVLTDTQYNRIISADLNLDGSIDEKDEAFRKTIKEKFKFAVLTSCYSFSCGNAFPCICEEEGIPIIGEQSSGGSCVVRLGCTADGFPYQFSSTLRVSHKADWSTVETGANITPGGEISEAADFYDDAKLQQIIDNVVK